MTSTRDALTFALDDDDLVNRIRDAKILLVGAGGIGCEVIKTMLLSGFTQFTLIDLDTIDVSNLNRQFLFNKTHVGQSKAEVAAKVAISRFAHYDLEKEAKDVNVTPKLVPIQNQSFDVEFFKSFTMVINALDNRAARSHVNRMCLAAGVPLIESGSEGYLGQTFLIQKGISACYECDGGRSDERTIASCTIRNTPSLPIHCIVWGKHLFAQLFGVSDEDNDVSPDVNDPELSGQSMDNGKGDTDNKNSIKSTRDWAESTGYDPKLIFKKLFFEDVNYLLKMEQLWENRRRPDPLDLEDILNGQVAGNADEINGTSNGYPKSSDLKDQRLWSLRECYDYFVSSVSTLKERFEKESFLVWDKDDEAALNFVTAVSNLRSHCFRIPRKSRFDVKSMAGNIIPAISSTNSIVGGLITLQAIGLLRKVLPVTNQEDISKEDRVVLYNAACRMVYVKKVGLNIKNLVAAYDLYAPNAKCLICSPNTQEVEVHIPFKDTKLYDFVDQIILQKLHFVCPDIQVEGLNLLLYNQEDADEESDEEKFQSRSRLLSGFDFLRDGTRLKIYDLNQNLTIIVTLRDSVVDPNKNDGQWYKFVVVNEGQEDKEEKEEEGSATREETDSNQDVLTLGESDDEGIVVEKVREPVKRPPAGSGVIPEKKHRLS